MVCLLVEQPHPTTVSSPILSIASDHPRFERRAQFHDQILTSLVNLRVLAKSTVGLATCTVPRLNLLAFDGYPSSSRRPFRRKQGQSPGLPLRLPSIWLKRSRRSLDSGCEQSSRPSLLTVSQPPMEYRRRARNPPHPISNAGMISPRRPIKTRCRRLIKFSSVN